MTMQVVIQYGMGFPKGHQINKGRTSPFKGTHRQTNTGRTWFKKGEHISQATEIQAGQRISPKTEFKKGMKPWNYGIKYDQITGDKHPLWKGKDVGYGALHSWIKRNLGKAVWCAHC